MPEDDPKQRQPNIELAEKLLGWRPTINFDEGLIRTVAYFEALLREHGKSIAGGRTIIRRLCLTGGQSCVLSMPAAVARVQ